MPFGTFNWGTLAWGGITIYSGTELEGFLITELPEEPITHYLTWRTDVHKSRNGIERRISIDTYPRQRYDANYLLDDLDRRAIRTALFKNPSQGFYLPLHFEALLATSSLPVAGSTLTFTSTTIVDWAVTGRTVLVEDTRTSEVYATVIQSATATSLTFTDANPGAAIPAGMVSVVPLAGIHVMDGGQIGRYPKNLGTWQLSGRVPRADTLLGTNGVLTNYAGIPVLEKRPSARNIYSETMQAGLDVVDFGARFDIDAPQTFADIMRGHEYLVRGQVEWLYWKKFLMTMRGRQGIFFLSTWDDDLLLSVQPNGTTILVLGGDGAIEYGNYTLDLFPSLSHRYLQFEHADGTIAYRTVSGAVDNHNGTQTLTLTASINGTINAIERVSFLEQCRLASDEVTFQHFAGSRSRVALPAVVVEQ